ncbi:hypothetical protein I4U23_022471 [Adineta vaga]|nr:hypothetical protein I4U23_022471 [Adineta vaga]
MQILFLFITLLCFIYLYFILFVRRFRHSNNLFIFNICISIILTCVYTFIYFLLLSNTKESTLCTLLYYAFNIACIAIPFSFVAFTIHRFCSLLYHTKQFFKTKKWIIICISSHWFIQFLISLPFVFRTHRQCSNELWMTIYTFITAVVLPSLINLILNTLIFLHVRSSTRRVQPQVLSAWTSEMMNQQRQRQQIPKISRREISLLRQMILMFLMFICGWIPTLLINIMILLIDLDFIIPVMSMVFSEICVIGIIFNLFVRNYELRELPDICILFFYIFNIASIGIPFAFVAFTIQRFCSLLYHTKQFFKTKKWIIICISSHWFIQFLISLPFVFRTHRQCSNELWMTIYTFITAVVLPSLINLILNTLIFLHVRSSTRRVQPQVLSAWTSEMMNQRRQRQQILKISRREISLLRQMILMFLMFICGWSPVFIVNIILQLKKVNTIIVASTILFSEICIMGIITNIFIHNYELKEFFINKIKICFRC